MFAAHLEKLKAELGQLPKTIVADAGYGGEENYAYLEKEELRAIVKYSTYHKEKSKNWKKDISKIDNWEYNAKEDTWTCAAEKHLSFIEPESVFGQMKNNRGFRRFQLRGLPKVSLEVGWLSLAHNLLKKASIQQKMKIAVRV